MIDLIFFSPNLDIKKKIAMHNTLRSFSFYYYFILVVIRNITIELYKQKIIFLILPYFDIHITPQMVHKEI